MTAPVDLPEHFAESDEWQAWPRKSEAHLRWGVRPRQIESQTRNGKLKVYACPDGTRRLDPDALTLLHGPPGVLQGRDRDLSASDRRARLVEASASATGDPMALMFGKAVSMMESLHAQLLGQLKVVSDPLKVLLDAYASTITALQTRCRELELQVDAGNRLRSELADAKQLRDLETKRAENAERRRDETLTLLKEQLPSLAKVWLEGNTLSEFAKRTPKGAIEAIVESGEISEQDASILRTAAGLPKPAPTTTAANGVIDHGHS